MKQLCLNLAKVNMDKVQCSTSWHAVYMLLVMIAGFEGISALSIVDLRMIIQILCHHNAGDNGSDTVLENPQYLPSSPAPSAGSLTAE